MNPSRASLQIPLPEQLNFQPRRLLKQADAQSEEWVQRYYELKKGKSFSRITTELATFFMPRFDLSLLEKL